MPATHTPEGENAMSRSAPSGTHHEDHADVIAVYSGTFDPLTLGHEDAIRRAAKMFDQVIIAVAVAHHKKTVFTWTSVWPWRKPHWPIAPMSRPCLLMA
jgi:cytidyltransferase-like protein